MMVHHHMVSDNSLRSDNEDLPIPGATFYIIARRIWADPVQAVRPGVSTTWLLDIWSISADLSPASTVTGHCGQPARRSAGQIVDIRRVCVPSRHAGPSTCDAPPDSLKSSRHSLSLSPCVGPGVCRFRIDPLRFLAEWRKSCLIRAFSFVLV